MGLSPSFYQSLSSFSGPQFRTILTFPTDKQQSSHLTGARYPTNSRKLRSRVSSHIYRHPNVLFRHSNHLDPWEPDMDDEKACRYCWKLSQCGHEGALLEEGMMGAGEAPQALNLKTQANFLSKQAMSSQDTRRNKLEMAPLNLSQERKRKTPDSTPAEAKPNSSAPNAEHIPTSQSSPPAQYPQDISCQGQPSIPDCISKHTIPQTQNNSKTLTSEPILNQIHGAELTSAACPVQNPAPTSLGASVPSLGYTPQTMASDGPAPMQSYVHANHDHIPVPNSVPVTPLNFDPIATPAPIPTPAPVSVPIPTLAPSLDRTLTTPPAATLISVPTPATFITPTLPTANHGLSTGHVVYDARRAKQNLVQMATSQNSNMSRKDLETLFKPQEGQGLVNSDTTGQISKPNNGDRDKPSTGSSLGNSEWKLSKDAENKTNSSKFNPFPYYSFNSCSCEDKSKDPQSSISPQFLVYSKDEAPSKPCFHSPTSTRNMQYASPPCNLSLPLAPPRSFVFHPPGNHLKANLNTSAILTTSKPPRSSPASQCPNPYQFSTISQPQSTKLHASQSIIRDSGHQKTPGPFRDPMVSRKPSLTQNGGLRKNPGLCKSLVTPQDSNLHKNSIFHEDLSSKSMGLIKDAGIIRNSTLTQPSTHYENVPLSPNFDSQKSPSCTQDSRVYRNLEQNQETVVYNKSQNSSQTSGLQNHPDSGIYKNLFFSQPSDLCKASSPTQESGDYKSLCHPQESNLHKNLGLSLVPEAKQKCASAQNVGIYWSPENIQDPNFHKYLGAHQDHGPSQKRVSRKDSGQLKHIRFSQEPSLRKESHLNPNPDPGKPSGFVQGIGSVQVLDSPQDPKPAQSLLKKSFVSKGAPHENAEPHVSWMSVPPNQNNSSKSHGAGNDLQNFSEVPVLVELQPSTKQTRSQEWVYQPVNIVPSDHQNYRQMSVPPKVNWKPYYPGRGTRLGHVVFDARQRQSGVGRDKCEALFPKHLRQEIPSNSAEWGYQCGLRPMDLREGTKMHQE